LAKVATRLSARVPSISFITAFGNPDVCNITCSTVTNSLPLAANSGMYSATRRAGSSLPSPMRSHAAPATIGFVHEKMQ